MGALYSRYLGWLLASGNKSILLGQVLVVNLSDHFVWILFVTTISALRELELTRTPKESIVVRQVKNALQTFKQVTCHLRECVGT
jgi:hypothetical protein